VPFLPETIYSGFLNFDPILYFTCMYHDCKDIRILCDYTIHVALTPYSMSMSILHSLPAYKGTTFVRETIIILHHIAALFTIQFIYYIILLWHQLYY